jgi:hypothetical protein
LSIWLLPAAAVVESATIQIPTVEEVAALAVLELVLVFLLLVVQLIQ